MNGVDLIAEERIRQINELGFDDFHDDMHEENALIEAACAYAFAGCVSDDPQAQIDEASHFWPFADGFHPTGSIADLVKAGALIAAAIDRRIRDVQALARREGVTL